MSSENHVTTQYECPDSPGGDGLGGDPSQTVGSQQDRTVTQSHFSPEQTQAFYPEYADLAEHADGTVLIWRNMQGYAVVLRDDGLAEARGTAEAHWWAGTGSFTWKQVHEIITNHGCPDFELKAWG